MYKCLGPHSLASFPEPSSEIDSLAFRPVWDWRFWMQASSSCRFSNSESCLKLLSVVGNDGFSKSTTNVGYTIVKLRLFSIFCRLTLTAGNHRVILSGNIARFLTNLLGIGWLRSNNGVEVVVEIYTEARCLEKSMEHTVDQLLMKSRPSVPG